MKRLIIVLLLIAYSSQLWSQVKFKCFLETGFLSEQNSLYEVYENVIGGSSGTITRDSNPFNTSVVRKEYNKIKLDRKSLYADIVFDVSIKNIHLEQQIYNIFSYDDGYTLTPNEILFKSRLYYEWKFIQFGGEHMCNHPIITERYNIDAVIRRASYDKIFVKFTFSN